MRWTLVVFLRLGDWGGGPAESRPGVIFCSGVGARRRACAARYRWRLFGIGFGPFGLGTGMG